MRALLPLLLIAGLAACSPDRSEVEAVFLEAETAPSAPNYVLMRTQAYRTLRQEGPASALRVLMPLVRQSGAEERSWELLPLIARLHIAEGRQQDARQMISAARIAQRLSLGELQCIGPGDAPWDRAGERTTAAGEEVGSALLVGMLMCPGFQKPYPARPKDAHDALFERKLAAVEALLNPPSEAPRKSS